MGCQRKSSAEAKEEKRVIKMLLGLGQRFFLGGHLPSLVLCFGEKLDPRSLLAPPYCGMQITPALLQDLDSEIQS